MAKRVIVTRPAEQAALWTTQLRQAGLDALSLPLITIGAPHDLQALTDAWARIDSFNAVMFVSANAVSHFFQQRPAALHSFTPRAFATGPGTVAALLACDVAAEGIDAPDAQAGQFDSEALWQVVRGQIKPGNRVLIVRGTQDAAEAVASKGEGRDWFAQQVEAAGAQVEFVVAYRRQPPVLGINSVALVQNAARDGSVWLFSSSEAVANLQTACPGQSWQQARAVATHPRIAQAAQDAGFGTVVTARPALSDIVASIESMP